MSTSLNYENLHTELDTLLDSLKTDDDMANENYEQLYNAIANGKERPDNATICNILRNAEKTTDDLKNDVEWRIKRSKMIEEYRLIPTLQAEHDKASTALRTLNAELEKLQEDYETKKQPYRTKLNQVEGRLRELLKYRDTLIRECRCEALTAGLRYEEFQQQTMLDQYNQLQTDIFRQKGRIGEAKDFLFQCEKMIWFDGMEERRQAAHATIHEAGAEVKRMQKQLDQLEPKLTAYDVEIERIKEQMLCE